jgi:hypothetical protein
MNAKDAIRSMMEMSWSILGRYVADLDDGDLLHRPGTGCNHLAWQLGHLITAEVGILNAVCPGAGPELPAGFAEQHDKSTVASDDPKKFCTKQEYVDLTKKVHEASVVALTKLPDADLDKPAPESFKQMFPTVGAVLMLIAAHPLMHAGQFVPVRRALGKPIVM